MHYIIIGAGPAGIVAAETLRKNDAHSEITVVGSEPEPPYSRMAIPYLLMDNIGEQGSYLRDSGSHFSDLNINVIQDSVTQLDASAKSINLAGGSSLNYDKLLIASGSRPVKPPIPGIALEMVQSCWTLQDARHIMQRAKPGSNVVLIGAGFIGCIILESLVQRGVNLTLIETGERMVPRMLNEKAASLLKSWCEQKAVTIKTACSVVSISDKGDSSAQVTLSDGSTLDANLVITATGVTPNADFLEDTQVQLDQGVLVNPAMQSSDPDIYAAGDVAQALDFSSGDHVVQAIQPTATDHGRIAALNMCGKSVEHHGSLNMNILDTLGLISCSFGLWMGVDGGDSSELYNAGDYRYLNLQFDGDKLVGASCTGLTQHIGVLRGLIESKVRLGVWKQRLMKDPTALMEAYMGCTQELG